MKMSQMKYESQSMELNIEEALDYAASNIAVPDAWMLAESPRKLIWEKWTGKSSDPALNECLKLYIFNDDAEIRLQREYGKEKGICRVLIKDENAKSTYVRFSKYMLADGKGFLKYAEHFSHDPSTGALNLEFGRYCGVEE